MVTLLVFKLKAFKTSFINCSSGWEWPKFQKFDSARYTKLKSYTLYICALVNYQKAINFSDQSDLFQLKMGMFGNSLARN